MAVAGIDPHRCRGAGDDDGALDGSFGVEKDHMIKRIFAFLLLLWMLGFAWFALFPAATGGNGTKPTASSC